MKISAFKSIKTRLIFWFLFIALTPLLITLVATYTQRANAIETQTFDKLIAIRDLKVNRLEQWLDERFGDLRVMSENLEMIGLEDIFDKKEKSPEDIEKIEMGRELLNSFQRNYISYAEIFIIGASTGLVEISTNDVSPGENKSYDSYFTVPLETGEIYIKDIYYSSTTNEPAMAISSPIFCLTHNEDIVGILVAHIDLRNSLYKMLLERVGLGETGETLIVNKNVVALNELRWYDNAPLNLQIATEPAVNAAQGKTGITVTTDYRGEEILAAYTYIHEIGWGFISKQDIYELNEPVREMILNFVILFVISAIMIYLVAFFIGNTISKPIIEMNVLSKKIRAGDYSKRNIIRSRDELGSLANSINEMTDSIERRNAIQKSVNDISETIIGQSSIEEFGSALLKQLMKITGSNMSAFYVLNDLTDDFEHFTSIGANEKLLKPFNFENPKGEFGNVLAKKSIYYLRDIPEDTILKFKTTAGDAVPKEIITIPILIENIVVALICLLNIHRFSKECYDIIEQSWFSINTFYSSLIANERTRILSENIYKTNEQLEDQTEKLQLTFKELIVSLKETENARDKIDAILKSVGDGLIVTDNSNRIILINHIAEDLFKVSLNEVVNRPIDFAIKDKTLREHMKSTLDRKVDYLFDFELPNNNLDKLLTFSARSSVIKDKQGRANGIITIFHDVTREREVDRMKTEFISTAAHELRTPLTSIQGFSEILFTRDNLDEQKKKKYISYINKQSENLAAIISDLLDISRIESGKSFILDKKPCLVGEVIRMAAEPFITQSKIHKFEFFVPNEHVEITVDKDKISQVLKNLISNAVKYSPEGGKIQIKGKKLKANFRVSVEDEGLGMTPEQVEQIFIKFYRADATNTAVEGTGLGMSIVKYIVEAHGGKVLIESEYSKGTKVTFTIPINKNIQETK